MEQSDSSHMRKAYELSFANACAALAASDLARLCAHTGAAQNGRVLSVAYFGSRVEIRVPVPAGPAPAPTGGPPPGVALEFSPADLPLADRILILHYLNSGERQPAVETGEPRPGGHRNGGPGGLAGEKLVSFKNLPGASFYAVPYQNRGPGRIARRFGGSLEEFRRACSRLGWPPEPLGDAACSIQVLPRIRGVVVLHLGDKEFPPDAGILHNESIVEFLPLEDVAVLAGIIATRLTRAF